jgi:hypothetical protein
MPTKNQKKKKKKKKKEGNNRSLENETLTLCTNTLISLAKNLVTVRRKVPNDGKK